MIRFFISFANLISSALQLLVLNKMLKCLFYQWQRIKIVCFYYFLPLSLTLSLCLRCVCSDASLFLALLAPCKYDLLNLKTFRCGFSAQSKCSLGAAGCTWGKDNIGLLLEPELYLFYSHQTQLLLYACIVLSILNIRFTGKLFSFVTLKRILLLQAQNLHEFNWFFSYENIRIYTLRHKTLIICEYLLRMFTNVTSILRMQVNSQKIYHIFKIVT